MNRIKFQLHKNEKVKRYRGKAGQLIADICASCLCACQD